MRTVTIYTNSEDAESLAVILLRAEVTYSVEKCNADGEYGYLFTVWNSQEDDEQ